MTALVGPRAEAAVETSGHAHGWQLNAVEHDDGRVSNRYECEGCDAVWFT